MSAIAGIYYLDGRSVEEAPLQRMLNALAHRGSDRIEVWCRGNIGLGCGLFFTTPESLKERLPLVVRDGQIVLVADARIDNREELIRVLDLSKSGEAITDSELIVASYERWGEDCAEKLVGDFAFVIWDERRQQLFCARDPMGIRPFYYHLSDRLFVFASEIKTLLCVPGVPAGLNDVRIAELLVPVFEDRESTCYEGIYRLGPSRCMIVSDRESRIWTYWEIDDTRELKLGSFQEYAEAFREVFTEAVRCRLRSIYPVGVSLSGGLDSSSIACTSAKISGEKIHTFSAVFPTIAKDDQRIDETPFVKELLSSYDFIPHHVRADIYCPVRSLSVYRDELIPAPSFYMDRAVFEAAGQQNCRVLLSGYDGDTVVSYGYECLDEYARAARWRDFKEQVDGLCRNFNTNPFRYLRGHASEYLVDKFLKLRWRSLGRDIQMISRYFGFSPLSIYLRLAIRPLIREKIYLLRTLLATDPNRAEWLYNKAINPRFAKETGLKERVLSYQLDYHKMNYREAHRYAITSGLIQGGAEMLSILAGVFSIDMRFPFFDRRVIEFCLSVPARFRLRDGWTRAVQRFAMKGILPEKVRFRTDKGNIASNFKARMKENQKDIKEILIRGQHLIERYIDTETLWSFYVHLESGSSEEHELNTIFISAVFAQWLSGLDRA